MIHECDIDEGEFLREQFEDDISQASTSTLFNSAHRIIGMLQRNDNSVWIELVGWRKWEIVKDQALENLLLLLERLEEDHPEI